MGGLGVEDRSRRARRGSEIASDCVWGRRIGCERPDRALMWACQRISWATAAGRSGLVDGTRRVRLCLHERTVAGARRLQPPPVRAGHVSAADDRPRLGVPMIGLATVDTLTAITRMPKPFRGLPDGDRRRGLSCHRKREAS
jgi:hypothetical protein